MDKFSKKSEDWLKTIHSDGSEEFVTPLFYQVGEELTFRLRLAKNHQAKKILFRAVTNGQEQAIEMQKEREFLHLAYYKVKFRVWQKQFHYRFKIVTDKKLYHFNALGLHSYLPPDGNDFKLCADFVPPSWLWERIFYQIFPDRFYDGNPANNVKNGEYFYQGHSTIAKQWGEVPGNYESTFNLDFFGGDLKGIRLKIPYLKRLGVNALWLNPIFLSPSNHKYDTQDYHKIDPHFGTEQELIELTSALHNEGMRIILDGVFNHTGSCHFWFNRDGFYPSGGAYHDAASPYADYYLRRENGKFHYWANFESLPTLNYQSEKLRDEIYRKENSVAQRYVKAPFHCDGWRLDVADTLARQDAIQLHHSVWPEFRASVKSANPEAYLMGECGCDASELLQGTELDGAMNYYGFCIPVRQWLSGQIVFEWESSPGNPRTMDAYELDLWLKHARSAVPYPVTLSMYNLLGSHDCARILYHLRGKSDLLKMAFAFLFTYPGVPGIYYGDEIGLKGGATNESARGCMEWEEKKWDHDMFGFVQKLIDLRKSSLALQRGGFLTLLTHKNFYSYARFLSSENILVILNRDSQSRSAELDCSALAVPENCQCLDCITQEKFSLKGNILKVPLASHGTRVLRFVS